MRLWSISPKYLDVKGLTALWRETLLAQKVLMGQTKGYTHHPQLIRFRATQDPIQAIGFYLTQILNEATSRGYHYDRSKIVSAEKERPRLIPVTKGQIEYEFQFFKRKLQKRNPDRLSIIESVTEIELNPIFYQVEGEIEPWEKIESK